MYHIYSYCNRILHSAYYSGQSVKFTWCQCSRPCVPRLLYWTCVLSHQCHFYWYYDVLPHWSLLVKPLIHSYHPIFLFYLTLLLQKLSETILFLKFIRNLYFSTSCEGNFLRRKVNILLFAQVYPHTCAKSDTPLTMEEILWMQTGVYPFYAVFTIPLK